MFNKNQEIMNIEMSNKNQPQDLIYLKSILQDLYAHFFEKIDIVDKPIFKDGDTIYKIISIKSTKTTDIIEYIMKENYSKIYLYTISENRICDEIFYIVRYCGIK